MSARSKEVEMQPAADGSRSMSGWFGKRTLTVALMVGASSIAGNAWATSINIDFDYANSGVAPANAYGAASGQAGVWNEISLPGGVGLVDLAGGASGASITVSAFSETTEGNPGLVGDEAALIEDYFYTAFQSGVPYSVSVTGLQDGTYDVYLYASAFRAGTGSGNVNGVAFADAWNPNRTLGMILGTHYTMASGVNVNGGTLLVSGEVGQSSYGLSGMQIVDRTVRGIAPIPEPATILLVGGGLAAAIRRRQRRQAPR